MIKLLKSSSVLLFSLFFSWLYSPLFGQNDLFFHELTSQNGLENTKVVFVFKDSRHFNWIGTLGGLYRFDGAEVVKYGQEKGINDPYLQSSMVEDQKGNLWFCSLKKLYCYDRLRDTCLNFGGFNLVDGEETFSDYSLIHLDTEDQLWLTAGNALFSIDLQKTIHKKQLIFQPYSTGNDRISGKRFFPILDPQKKINGFFEYRFYGYGLKIWTLGGKNTFSSRLYFADSKNDQVAYDIRQVLPHPSQKDKYILCTSEGLKIFDITKKNLQNLFTLSTETHFIYAIFIKPHLLLCSTNEALYYFDLTTGKHSKANDWSDRLNSNTISHQKFTELVLDRDGILWGLVYDEGLCFTNPELIKTQFIPMDFGIEYLEVINAREILIAGQKGLYLFDGQKILQQFLINERVTGFYTDKQLKLIWVLTDQKIYHFHPQSKKLTLYLNVLEPTMGLYRSVDNTYWISSLFDTKRLNLTKKQKEPLGGQLDSLLGVYNIWEDSIYQRMYLHENGSVYHIYKNRKKEKSFSLNGRVGGQIILRGSNKIWIAGDNGITSIDRNQLTIENFIPPADWPSSSLTGIAQDKRGIIWISANTQLLSFSASGKPLRIFSQKEGFFSAPFQFGTLRPLDENNYIIGGRFGLTQFNTRDLEKKLPLPKIRLTRLMVQGRPYHALFPNDTSILEKNFLKLKYNQNSIALRLVAIDFSMPTHVKIQYYLEGQEKATEAATRNQFGEIRYGKLAPGKYYLMARAANAHGDWSSWEQKFELEIIPPFWMRWWFILLVSILCIFILFGLVQLYFRAQLREARIRNEEQERILRDIHDLTSGKVVFFQDFQIFAEQEIPHPEAKTKALGIAEQALQLFKRISAAVRNSTESDSTLVEFLHQLIADSKKNIGTNLGFSAKLDSSIPYAWVAGKYKNQLRLVVQEALGNILKHAEASSVLIHVGVEGGKLNIAIQDDGKGLSEAQIAQIKPTVSIQESGNGLGNMLSRMNSIGGEIKWINQQGTCVIISIFLQKIRPKRKIFPNFI